MIKILQDIFYINKQYSFVTEFKSDGYSFKI